LVLFVLAVLEVLFRGAPPAAETRTKPEENQRKTRRDTGDIKGQNRSFRAKKSALEATESSWMKGGWEMDRLQLSRVWRVAKELDVSKKRIYQMVNEGKIDAVRLGPRSMRITRDSIDRFITTGRKTNREEKGLDYKRS
jgi:excisionase family DNA binding protein